MKNRTAAILKQNFMSAALATGLVAGGFNNQAQAQTNSSFFPGTEGSGFQIDIMFSNPHGASPVTAGQTGTFYIYSPFVFEDLDPGPNAVVNFSTLGRVCFGSEDYTVPFGIIGDRAGNGHWLSGGTLEDARVVFDFYDPSLTAYASTPPTLTYGTAAERFSQNLNMFQGIGSVGGFDNPSTLQDESYWANFQITRATWVPDLRPIPEPSTLALAGLGAASLLVRAWRRRKDGTIEEVVADFRVRKQRMKCLNTSFKNWIFSELKKAA